MKTLTEQIEQLEHGKMGRIPLENYDEIEIHLLHNHYIIFYVDKHKAPRFSDVYAKDKIDELMAYLKHYGVQ